jgi:hypothetical protein
MYGSDNAMIVFAVFVSMMPYSLLDRYQRFGAVRCLHFQDKTNFPLPNIYRKKNTYINLED